MMHLTSVDLPAPFSPSSAWTLPASTRIETSSSAASAPKRLDMPAASREKRAGHGNAATTPVGVGDRAEHAALHLDHLDRGVVVAAVGRAAAILEQQAFEAAVVGLAHGGVDADVGGDAGQHDVADAAGAQDQLEVGGAERALARLVDDRLAGGAGRGRR